MKAIASLRHASALVGFALIVASPVTVNAANFSGTWTFDGTIGHPVIMQTAPVCVFRQSGNSITGNCKGPNASGSVSGAVNGRAITFVWHSVSATRRGTATFRGTLGSDGTIRGTFTGTATPGLTGVFSGHQM